MWSDFQGDKAMPQGDEAQEGEEATITEATSSTEGGEGGYRGRDEAQEGEEATTAEATSSTSEGDGEGGYRGRRRGRLRPNLLGYPRGNAPWRKDSHRVPGLQKTMPCRFWIRGENNCRKGQFCTYAHGEAELRPVPGHFKFTKSLKGPLPDCVSNFESENVG